MTTAIVLLCIGQVVNADYDYDGDVDLADFRVRQLMDPRQLADDPSSWLLVFNADNSDSILHALFYRQHHPGVHVFGVIASSLEKIRKAEYLAEIADPLRRWLAEHPVVNARVFGIIVGYRVPGQYVIDRPPWGDSVGGYSVAGSLQNLSDDRNQWRVPGSNTVRQFPTIENPHWFRARAISDEQQLSRTTIAAGHYMTARIDGPTLAIVEQMTLAPITSVQTICSDWIDPSAPRGEWLQLHTAVERLPTFDWLKYDSDGPAPADCWGQFSYYRLDWRGYEFEPDTFAFAMNSFGARRVRSGSWFVPSALRAGFPIALGATGEPSYGAEPDPATIVWCLARGWTVGESFFRATRWDNWMWTLFADPLSDRGTIPVEP